MRLRCTGKKVRDLMHTPSTDDSCYYFFASFTVIKFSLKRRTRKLGVAVNETSFSVNCSRRSREYPLVYSVRKRNNKKTTPFMVHVLKIAYLVLSLFLLRYNIMSAFVYFSKSKCAWVAFRFIWEFNEPVRRRGRWRRRNFYSWRWDPASRKRRSWLLAIQARARQAFLVEMIFLSTTMKTRTTRTMTTTRRFFREERSMRNDDRDTRLAVCWNVGRETK